MRFIKVSYLRPGPEIIKVQSDELHEYDEDPLLFLRSRVGWPALLDDYDEIDDD